jgi:methionyl-tRNA formyltransferase
MTKLKIGFFADGPWSHLALVKILSDETLQVCFICARYDNPDAILKALALRNNLVFITHPKINSHEFLDWVETYNCELFVSMSFNQIFQKN